MSTATHDSPAPQRQGWTVRLRVPEMWASFSIAMMWLAVLFDAIYGPDFVSTSPGGSSTTIPSSIIVAVFAYLGTRAVARYGFTPPRDSAD